eukprot:scaffold3164_cov376-Prasinococcus_capsulatus_cf.AAC.7
MCEVIQSSVAAAAATAPLFSPGAPNSAACSESSRQRDGRPGPAHTRPTDGMQPRRALRGCATAWRRRIC